MGRSSLFLVLSLFLCATLGAKANVQHSDKSRTGKQRTAVHTAQDLRQARSLRWRTEAPKHEVISPKLFIISMVSDIEYV
jgi:hypothetical protein